MPSNYYSSQPTEASGFVAFDLMAFATVDKSSTHHVSLSTLQRGNDKSFGINVVEAVCLLLQASQDNVEALFWVEVNHI